MDLQARVWYGGSRTLLASGAAAGPFRTHTLAVTDQPIDHRGSRARIAAEALSQPLKAEWTLMKGQPCSALWLAPLKNL